MSDTNIVYFPYFNMNYAPPSFERSVLYTQGHPMIITIRPTYQIARGQEIDQAAGILVLAAFTRSSIATVVHQYNGWGEDRIGRSVRGYLSASNLINGNTVTFSAVTTFVNTITADYMANIMAVLQQSNETLLLSDVEWRFNLNHASIIAGASSFKIKIPSWAPANKFVKTWNDYQGVSCAAFALVYLMKSVERDYKHYPDRAIDDAKDLMELMSWEESTSISDLSRFVNHFPDYRLTVITPYSIGSNAMSWEGDDFVFDRENVKYLYLVLDQKQGEFGHFAATKSPEQILRKSRNSGSVNFCHRCVVSYLADTHACEDHVRKKRKVSDKPCPKGCGRVGIGHDCPLIKCKTCPSIYTKNNDDQSIHRCIVYKEQRERKFVGEDGDGKHPNLWAYDLEARIEKQHSSVERICDFKLIGDTLKYVDSVLPSEIAVYDYCVYQHKANMVVATNQFNNLTKIFKGDNCLEQFLLFILDYNKGNNVLLAHNASGYDSRLLYDAANKVSSKVQMGAILRGSKFMQLTVGNCIFRDSLLHVKGSLKSLAKSFCDTNDIRKGFFPHSFNTAENWDSDYVSMYLYLC